MIVCLKLDLYLICQDLERSYAAASRVAGRFAWAGQEFCHSALPCLAFLNLYNFQCTTCTTFNSRDHLNSTGKCRLSLPTTFHNPSLSVILCIFFRSSLLRIIGNHSTWHVWRVWSEGKHIFCTFTKLEMSCYLLKELSESGLRSARYLPHLFAETWNYKKLLFMFLVSNVYWKLICFEMTN